MAHPSGAADDEKNRPRDIHEEPREDVERAEQEVDADQDREDREHLVMRTIADLALFHFVFHAGESMRLKDTKLLDLSFIPLYQFSC